jgi:glycosyltransferase involved in cell wall biosynthesis
MPLPFCIIIPANNEAAYIEACLAALLAQDTDAALLVIVAANACRDDTVARAQALAPEFAARGWRLICLDLPDPGKTQALNRAETALPDAWRGAGLSRCGCDL